MAPNDDEEKRLRSVALQNAQSILAARQRAEEELVRAKQALELRTQELAHSAAMLRATLESTTDGILVTDGNGKVTDFNEKFVKLWGLSRDILITRDHRQLQEAICQRLKDPRQFLARIEAIYASPPPESYDLLELVDGRAFDRSSSVQFADGQNVGRVWSYRDITERRRAEEVVQKQAEWLRVTLSSIGDAVITTGTDGRVTSLNPVAQSLTGWTQDEAQGVPLDRVFSIINERTRLPVENPALRALQEGVIVGLANHTILVAKDGTERPIDDSAAPIRDATGNIAGCVLVFRDITARVNAEAALAERVRLFALTADVGIALTQGNTLRDILQRCAEALVEHLAGAFARIWTFNSAEDVLELQASAGLYTHLDGPHGRVPVGQFKIGLIAQERKAHLTNAVVGDPRVAEQEWAKKEGMVAFAGYPLLVDDRLVGVVAMFARHPLSSHTLDAMAGIANAVAVGIDRKRAEQEVARVLGLEQERSERLWQVAAASLAINSATTPTSVVGVIRAEATRIIGAQHCEVSLSGGEGPPPAGALTAPLIGRGGRPFGRIHLTDKEAGPFTADDEAILTQLAHLAAVAFDNARLCDELRDADRRKDEFLAALAHELRNPLAPIRNSLQVMRVADNNPAVLQHCRDVIDRQVQQMVRLVDDLLDVARIATGKIELRKAWLALEALVHSALETSRPLIEAAQHKLIVTLPPEPLLINGDLSRLAQVVSNLLNNAAKYTPPGGCIRLIGEQCADGVVIRVRDNGTGIPADKLPRIFDMFTQLDRNLDRAQGGLGIGLSLVRRLVEMHGRTVEARSAGPGQGSEFVVRLPAPLEQPTQPPPADVERPVVHKSAHRILIADDNQDSADSLARLLRVMGNDTRTVYDGQAAVEAALAFRPDVVLLDIGMPKLNGLEAARRLREQERGSALVLIALTGWGQEEDVRRTQEAGFDHHMVKPIDPEALEKLLVGLELFSSRHAANE